MGKQFILLVSIILLITMSSLLSIIPHPTGERDINEDEIVISERFSPRTDSGRISTLPQNVLVLMVEFEDIRFAESISNQDYLANPDYTVKDFIDRFMFHLQSYYLDVSKDAYKINYSLFDNIITLPQPMAFYGDPDRSLERRIRMAQDVISIIDPEIDFGAYDSYIIMHAGAGRESDIYGTNPNAISSSFINRRLLQAVLDPENDDFPGLETEDGIYVQELVISATNHDHPDNPEDLNYGTLGLLCHLFGRQMGLPTLFGNVASMGRAAGAGNFCLMGTGVWNANGFVPPFLSAWTRYFAGWAEPVTVRQSREALQVTYPFNTEEIDIPMLYKIVISEDEYYLLENRQQNPDGSNIGGQANFTFRLLPDDEQDYYEDFPDVPRFNFMKNSYRGCEWDFFLPGYGGPEAVPVDGSGILIWHIDENVIRENYEINRINANPNHQGVTLQEADGIQHLRSGIPDIYMRGSPYDSYRRYHNSYFGKLYKDDGTYSLPYAESYYGEIDLEIYNISRSHNVMSFSVRYPWSLEYDYEGNDILPGAMIFDEDDNHYLLQVTGSGNIYLFRNYELLPGYPVVTESIPHLYAYLEETQTFIVPVETKDEGAARYLITPDGRNREQVFYEGYKWATHPTVMQNSGSPGMTAVALTDSSQSRSIVRIYDDDFELHDLYAFENGTIASNMMYKNNRLSFFLRRNDNGSYHLQKLDLTTRSVSSTYYPLPEGTRILSSIMAPVTKTEKQEREYADNILVLTNNNGLYLFDVEGQISSGFPVSLPEEVLSVPSLGDVNRNGYLDILMVSSNSLFVVGYNGEIINYPVPTELTYPEEESGRLGVVALDLTGDGNQEIIAGLGGSRFAIWNNRFRLLDGYPVVVPGQPRNYPLPVFKDETIDIYLTADNGTVFRHSFDRGGHYQIPSETWIHEYGNLQRSGSYDQKLPENTFATERIFIKEHCYVFPVPVTHQTGGILYFNIMVNQNLPVEVKVFDITGKLIFKDIHECQAYTNNRDKLSLDINGLATGVYFALFKAGGETMRLRFAVER